MAAAVTADEETADIKAATRAATGGVEILEVETFIEGILEEGVCGEDLIEEIRAPVGEENSREVLITLHLLMRPQDREQAFSRKVVRVSLNSIFEERLSAVVETVGGGFVMRARDELKVRTRSRCNGSD